MVSIEQETENVLLQMYKKKITFMIDGQNFFDQPDKSDKRTCDNIRKLQLVKEMITQLVVY